VSLLTLTWNVTKGVDERAEKDSGHILQTMWIFSTLI